VSGWVGVRECACARACVVLLNQHAKRMLRTILSSVACLSPAHFSTSSQKMARLSRGGGGYRT
jgi:hypothetical protein